MEEKRVLVLAPHTDDGEFGCGGTLNKLVESGSDVYYVSFSFARKSLPPGTPFDSTEKELYKATSILGIEKQNLILFDYEVRTFPNNRQNILDDMLLVKKDIKPNLVFLPNSKDTHQDHNVIFKEGYRAFKRCSLLGFESIWNNSIFAANFFVRLEESNIDKKVESLKCYKSQHLRDGGKPEIMKMLSRIRGSQIGSKYAECFEDIRYITS